MATDFEFRRNAVKQLTNKMGVYVLCDLDNIPIYVGQSTDGIRSRVARHLTSARSDIIANRQIDVWEIAYVWTYPVENKSEINALESGLIMHFHKKSPLFNGKIPVGAELLELPEPLQVIRVMPEEEISIRQDAVQRLPRQASHYAQIVSHFLTVKNSNQIASAMSAHFQRLQKYHKELLEIVDYSQEDN